MNSGFELTAGSKSETTFAKKKRMRDETKEHSRILLDKGLFILTCDALKSSFAKGASLFCGSSCSRVKLLF